MIIPQKFEFTDKVLHKPALALDFVKIEKNKFLADRMVQFMKTSNGIGLAAPQIGIPVRLFVMQVGTSLPMQCFNPEILGYGNQLVKYDEGCLSFPDEFVTVVRPANIHVRYQNHAGHHIESRLFGLSAICFQHELDHLDGIVMHDRAKEQEGKDFGFEK